MLISINKLNREPRIAPPRHSASAWVARKNLSSNDQWMSQTNSYEIAVDGKPRSYRDDKTIAFEAPACLKMRNPHSGVTVRDLASGEAFPISPAQPGWTAARRF
jgi:hypothetical protein